MRSLYSIMVMATGVVGVMKMGNIAPRAGIKPTSLAFWPSVLTTMPPRLPDVTTLPMLTWLCGIFPDRSVQTTTLFIKHLHVTSMLYFTFFFFFLGKELAIYLVREYGRCWGFISWQNSVSYQSGSRLVAGRTY